MTSHDLYINLQTMKAVTNSQNEPNQLLQTVAQADFRAGALLDAERESVDRFEASTPEFRMVCQPIRSVGGHGLREEHQ